MMILRGTARNLMISLATLTLFFSCVGTIEDKNPGTTKAATVGEEPIPFNGLTRANAVSNTKVELYFFPAPGIPDNLTYLIYVNNNLTPIEVKGSALELNPMGEYRYSVSGLAVNTLYDFKVGVRDGVSGTSSANDKSMQARTFANITADFEGITNLYPAAGVDGQTSLVAEWLPAVTLAGNTHNPRNTDPIGYEVRYMPATAGSPLLLNQEDNPNVVVRTIPSIIDENTNGTEERSRLIPGLLPDTRYYVQVRAIHKSYGVFKKDDANYVFEQNTKFLVTSTRSTAEIIDFDFESLEVTAPDGDDGLSQVDLRWAEASGPYRNYRLYVVKAAEPNATAVDLDAVSDLLTTDDINTLNLDPLKYTIVSPGTSFYRQSNLTTYAYYHAKVAVCFTAACGPDDRLVSSLASFRVVPKIASFSGLANISNPQDASSQDRIKLSFEPAVVSTGVVTALEVYCYSNLTDTSPVLVPVGGTILDGTKTNCDGLGRITPSPTVLSAFSTFNQIELNGVRFSGSVAENNYCLSVIPVIVNANYVRRDFDSAVIRCARPEIVPPSLSEFPGPIDSCTVTSDTMQVRWSAPTGGIYSNFEVFWKEVDGTPFRYAEAILGNYNSLASLAVPEVLNVGETEYLITDLKPGRRYQYGVLTYSISGDGSRIYSEFNQNSRECQLNRPVATFQEWIDIMAIGPKENGLLPHDHADRFALETFDEKGLPIEVEVNSTKGITELFEAQFGDRAGNVEFNGVYGSFNANPAGVKNQYSNSGMIRFAWKDVVVSGEVAQDLRAVTPLADTTALKPERKFGYKVYRSDDGKLNWKELTADSYSFQSVNNAGLIHASTVVERDRSNLGTQSYNAVIFTDYSVQSFDYRSLDVNDHDRVDRARTYYYKVVPVYDGMEINYVDSASSSPQNIIRITLPPKNMALVHRLMANRQTCKELDKSYSTNKNLFYTCDYNGIGSRGLSTPWQPGNTVYDVGGDVLVDRFEMGCDISRGDIANAESRFTGTSEETRSFDFLGLADGDAEFKGCLMSYTGLELGDIGSGYAPMSPGQFVKTGVSPDPSSSFDSYKQILHGDCFGGDYVNLPQGSTICGDAALRETRSYIFPGARVGTGTGATGNYNCTVEENLAGNYFSLFSADTRAIALQNVVAQSEFAGVYATNHHRTGGATNRSFSRYRSGRSLPTNDSELRVRSEGLYPSSCFVNLPVRDQGDANRLKPRWFPVNKLSGITYVNEAGVAEETRINLLSQTIPELLADFRFYDDDSSRNSVPGTPTVGSSYIYPSFKYGGDDPKYTTDTPIARLFSSNAAKLQPLDGMGQEDFNQICSTYEVEVGQLDGSGNFISTQAAKPKNLMRKKEFIAAAAWDFHYSSAEIIDVENGAAETAPVDSGGAGTLTMNGACNSLNKDVNSVSNNNFATGDLIDPRVYDTLANPAFFTGSSFFDHPDANTQSCQSRYGIQDLVGNRAEVGTERFFCDYSQEQLYIGIKDQTTNSVAIEDATIIDETITPWILGTTDSGRCSPASTGDDRSRSIPPADGGPEFVPRSFQINGLMAPVLSGFGDVNTSLVLRRWNYDQEGLDQLRNGDGHFLDFGTTGIGSPIDAYDTLALRATSRSNYRVGDTRRGSYFNPVVGIPLECSAGSCLDSLDNMNYITAGLLERITGSPEGSPAFNAKLPDYVIGNFPVGNSQIRSSGMSEYRYDETWTTGQTVSRDYTYIDAIYPGAAPGFKFTTDTKNTSDPDAHTARRVRYSTQRGQSLSFRNGGHSQEAFTGRYTASLDPAPANPGGHTTNSGRCSIMINKD